MNLGQQLARTAARGLIGASAARKIRREHDLWARTVQLHTPYYTLQPTTTSDPLTMRPIHASFTFVEIAKWGPRTGQPLTGTGTGSWTLWYECGPFTTERMPTAADRTAEDERAYLTFRTRAQAGIQQLYPASVERLVAA